MTKNKSAKRVLLAVISSVLIVCSTVGVTLAYIIDKTDVVKNTFIPAAFEISVNEDFTEGDTEKKNVSFTNDGETGAFIRAAIVINWQNDKGEVYAALPAEGTDYTISINNSDWTLGADGYYYLPAEVAPGIDTPVLVNSLTVTGEAPAEGYTLSVDIIASGIQSRPDSAVADAWGHTACDGVLTVVQ